MLSVHIRASAHLGQNANQGVSVEFLRSTVHTLCEPLLVLMLLVQPSPVPDNAAATDCCAAVAVTERREEGARSRRKRRDSDSEGACPNVRAQGSESRSTLHRVQ
eukprot:2972128-Rhodomonas_salina.1